MSNPNNQAPVLELRNLCKSFGGLEVTKNINLSVEKGHRLALIGPNGAGKTTIFNLISGVYAPTEGRILLGGTDITDVPSRKRIRYGVARNFQNVRLMQHLTVLENLVLGQHVHAGGILDMLNPFRFKSSHRWWKEAMLALVDARLEEYANETVGALPYGIRKRVDLTRARLANPSLLLLDEPAAGLNPAESEELLKELHDIADQGITLVVVEHDMHFVHNFCDTAVVLNFGEMIAQGPMDEVQQHPKVREAYLGAAEETSHAA